MTSRGRQISFGFRDRHHHQERLGMIRREVEQATKMFTGHIETAVLPFDQGEEKPDAQVVGASFEERFAGDPGFIDAAGIRESPHRCGIRDD